MQETETLRTVQEAIALYAGSIIRLAFSYVKNLADAEDIAQDVFVAYWQAQPAFESREHERAWFFRVAINKSKNAVKAGWFKSRYHLPESLAYLPKEQSEILAAVLALPQKYRLPIHLHYYEGYSIAEIARLLGSKPATVGTRLSRGRSLLKSKLGGFEDD